MFDREPSVGVTFCAPDIGIDLDPAHSKQFLYAAAHSGVESFSQNGIRGRLGKGLIGCQLRSLLGLNLALLACAPEREQCNDVLGGQRRLGAVGYIQLVGRTVKSERYIVASNARRRFHIDHRLDAYWVGKDDVTALQVIGGAVEGDVPFRHVQAPQNRGARGTAAQS